MNLYMGVRVDLLEPSLGGKRLFPVDVASPVKKLALEIVKLHFVEIGDANLSDSSCCQLHRCWASQASRPDDKRFRSL